MVVQFRFDELHHNGTIRTFRVVLFILVRICCATSQYNRTIRTRTIRTSRYNGTIRTKPIRKIPRTVVPGICFVRVIVIDFDFVFVDNDFLDKRMDERFRLFQDSICDVCRYFFLLKNFLFAVFF